VKDQEEKAKILENQYEYNSERNKDRYSLKELLYDLSMEQQETA